MGLGTRPGNLPGRLPGRLLGRLRPTGLGRRSVIAVLVLLLATVGIGGWLLTRRTDAQAAQTVTGTVATGTFQQTVSATGTLEPTHEADLDFGVSGRVTSVLVSAGDKVTKGDVLARLDRTSLNASLASAQAQLNAAQAQYSDDTAAAASSTQLASDSASVAAAESGLSQAQDDLASATLNATMSGTVASVDLTVGDQVSGTSTSSTSSSTGASNPSGGTGTGNGNGNGSSSSSASSSSTTTQVVIISPRLFKVAADVAADDITSVRKGMQAQVTPSGATAPVYGTVTSVGLVAAANSSGAATFPVTVTITGPQSKIYAGTSATVSIITKQVTGVLSVPTLALHTSGATTYVEKLVNGAQVKTTVKVGETYGPSTQVTSGLKAGDKVVITTVRLPTGTGGSGNNNQRPGGGFGQFPGGGGGGPPGGNFNGGNFTGGGLTGGAGGTP
jgi:multidrug efflux pump subunit AcrA (membrane-fusion protein)